MILYFQKEKYSLVDCCFYGGKANELSKKHISLWSYLSDLASTFTTPGAIWRVVLEVLIKNAVSTCVSQVCPLLYNTFKCMSPWPATYHCKIFLVNINQMYINLFSKFPGIWINIRNLTSIYYSVIDKESIFKWQQEHVGVISKLNCSLGTSLESAYI